MEPCSTQKLASLCSGGPVALGVSPLLPLLNPTSCLNDTASVTEVLMHQRPDDTLFVADENAAAGHRYDMRTLFDEIEKSEIEGEPAEEATRVERGAKLLIAELEKANPLMIFDKHANLKYKFGNRRFWAEGYYVSTVGLNEATIAKYIREQEAADIALDKLSVKEYSDPFKK